MGAALCSWWALTPRVSSCCAQVCLVGGGLLLSEGGVIDCLPLSSVTVGPPPMLHCCYVLGWTLGCLWDVSLVCYICSYIYFHFCVFLSIIVLTFRIISLLSKRKNSNFHEMTTFG